jgi:hypothetical protein
MPDRLPGGFVTDVVRIGDTVRRRPAERHAFVHALLVQLREAGWDGAPEFLGFDGQGREILGYIDGHVAWEPTQPAAVTSVPSLTRAGELIREFHDLTAPLADGGEVICHNDLSPKNTVYRDFGQGLRPIAFIDWDMAAPGERLHDVAHACWQYPGLGPGVDSLAGAARGMRAICDGYGLTDRGAVVSTVLWWQDRCWRGIEDRATAGIPEMVRLRDSGAARSVREQYGWVAAHRAGLEALLR